MSESDERPSSDRWSMGMEKVKVDLQRAVTGGVIACIIIFIGSWDRGALGDE